MHHITPMFFFLHHLILTTASSYYPVADIAVNCGSSGNSIAFDGREWTADIRSHGKSMSSKILQSLSVDPIPYASARLSRSEFAYTFQVSPGQKFIRLHFYPASYSGFKKSRAVFTVKAGAYTLLSNFSASLTADVLGLKSFAKEFCVNVEESEALNIIFSPSPSTSNDIYAFVNGIEIISMPTGLYYTPDGDPGAHVVGQKYQFHIDNNTALELVHRLNSGGSSISSVEDWGMFRRWSEDSNYLLELGVLPVTTSTPIKYTNIPMHTAPQRVYQTAWLMDPNKQACNLTWKLPVDLGFRYLVRLHFCELDFGIKEVGQREFGIFINNKTAEARADLIKWSGGNGVALYGDYVVMMAGNRMEGKSDLLISLQACYNESSSKYHIGAILNGIEVFKLSNPDNNLAGQNPNSLAHSPALTTPKLQKLIIAFGNKNVIISGLIILLSSLNVIVYQLRCWAERADKKDRSESSKPKELCRCFSLGEIQLATDNFDDALIIGIGGFGKVYKGLINKGATTVAVKRLKSMSKQGAEEFWTEIKMLSYLRHTHLVTLIGYCNDGNEMILVYEYMVNGTLADHLHGISRNGNGRISPLCWEQRLSICLGAARGLEYLHTGAQHRVIHRDVKTSNILLDENWVAKISDFGLSKMGGNATNQSSTYVITEVKGTFGYLDVEYFLTHRLTRKSDVYAFGVVLFEVLCGRPAVDKRFEGEERSLALWAQRCIKEGKHDQMIDSTIKEQISPHCLKVFLEVANKCLHNRPSERPRMSDVVQRLEFALASQDQNAYSSTDTEVEQEEAINVSMSVNMSIDTIMEGEEEKGKGKDEEVVDVDVADIKKVDVIRQPTVSQQPIDSPVLIPDSTSSMPKEKANKKSLTKFIQSIGRWRKTKANNSSDGSSLSGGMSTAKEKPSQALPESSCSSPPLPALPGRSFSLAEIHAATNNFHRNLVIKYGGPGGEMYRGYIDNGELQVAIERRITESENKFLEEVVMRSQIHHLHLVSFIGYCKNSGETIIVYEYMVKGSLRDHLYGTGNDPLPWKKRLEICIGAAQGIHYLHTCSQGPIIHGDLKSSSILLDDKWVAKVSGLEASKLELDLDGNNMTGTLFTHVIMKTHAYKDPEYLMSGHLTTKSDVYSFGVVLLEILCAVEPYSPHLARGQTYLTHRFKRCIQAKTIERIIDPYLIGKIVPKSLRVYVKIADCCLGLRGVERPSMNTVVESLQQALQLQETDKSSYKFIEPSDPPENIHKAAIRAYNKVL